MTNKNYKSIAKNILDYLPSRALIILNSLLIIPLLTGTISQKEISLYFVVIQILNLVCTCSFDGIGKAVLRFYEKHVIEKDIDKFISNILILTAISYIIILIAYLLFNQIITAQLSMSNITLFLTLILIVPCGIRQILYQILRIKNLSNVYTISIIFYQILFVLGFLSLTRIIPSTNVVIGSMIIAVTVIDIYVLKNISLDYKIQWKLDKDIINEILSYILPLFLTNFCYWFILNFSKLAFQSSHQYTNTSLIGVSWALSNNFIQPLITLFIFATFPVIIKKFEHNRNVKNYFTNIIQLFMFIFIPIIFVFCAFPDEICKILLPDSYSKVATLLPIFAISVFLHEFLKLVNIKYHLENKTYIETLLAIFIVALSFLGTMYSVQSQSTLMAAGCVLLCEIGLIFSSICIRFKNLQYIKYSKVLKTVLFMIIICIFCAYITLLFNHIIMSKILYVIKIFVFIALSYTISIKLKKYLLE